MTARLYWLQEGQDKDMNSGKIQKRSSKIFRMILAFLLAFVMTGVTVSADEGGTEKTVEKTEQVTAKKAAALSDESGIDLGTVFSEWVNYPGASLGAGYQAGWGYNASTGALNTTANVGFTGYYNPNLMSFTTGTWGIDFQSSDTDPWGYAWGIKKWQNDAGQDCYSFYIYEECGCNRWSISYINEWIPAKDTTSHRGPVYHSTISAKDGEYSAHNGATGTVGFATGKVLAYGSVTVKGVRHRITIDATKAKVTLTNSVANFTLLGTNGSNAVQDGNSIVVDAPIQAGSFGPCSASNAVAYFYNLSMVAGEDNGAIRADFQPYCNSVPTYAGNAGGHITFENTSWLDPDTKATIKSQEWVITYNDPESGETEIYRGSEPFDGTFDKEGEYKIYLGILSSQGLSASKTKYFTVTEENTLTVKYIDESGNKLCDDFVYTGQIGTPYQTSALAFNGYTFYTVDGEESGYFSDKPLAVTYVYKPIKEEEPDTPEEEEQTEAGQLTVKYVDEDGNEIFPDLIYKGEVGDAFQSTSLNIPGYSYVGLAADSAAETGRYGFQDKTVTYVYSKTDYSTTAKGGTLLVRYVDKNGNTVSSDVVVNTRVGSMYTINRKYVLGYRVVDIQGEETVTITDTPQVVTIVYENETYTANSVIARYVDTGGTTIRSDDVFNGNEGETFEINPAYIDDYKYAKIQNEGELNVIENDPESGYVKGEFSPTDIQIIVYEYAQIIKYDVTGVKYGHGTISGGGHIVEGEDSSITWKPDEGYKVSSVMVDGDVRDDLLNKGAGNTISFTDIHEDHVVKVEFEAKSAGGDEEEEEPVYFTVTTEQKGGSGESTISRSKTLAAGSDYTVEWQPGGTDVIKSITVDGKDYPTDKSSVEFRQLSSNHYVVVVYEDAEPEEEEKPETDGFYTIKVNSIDGDSSGTDTAVTGNAVVEPGSSHTVTWMAQGNYEVSGVVIDKGKASEVTLTPEEVAEGNYAFEDVAADHTVDVTFQDNTQNPDDPQPMKLKVETQLTGGPGQITGSATVNEGDSYRVEWDTIVKMAENPEDPAYAVYRVKEILINGKVRNTDANFVELKDITEDQTVKVVMEPALHQVETKIVGMGTIDPSKTLWNGQNYTVAAIPADGWVLQSVTIDDELQYEKPAATVGAGTEAANAAAPVTVYNVNGEVTTNINDQAAVPVNVSIQSITMNHKIYVEFAKADGTQADTEELREVTGRIEGGPGVFAGSGSYEAGSSADLSWTVPDGYEVVSVVVKVNGAKRNDITPSGTALTVEDIQDDYDITITLKKTNGSAEPEPGGETEDQTWTVTTAITNGEGEITPTKQNLADGSNWSVEWDYDEERFVVKEVRIDGVTDDGYLNQKGIDFEYLSADHSVEIVLAAKDSPAAPDQSIKEEYVVSTERTQGGTIDPSAAVEKGGSHTVQWAADEGYYVASVTVDGVKRDDLIGKGRADFLNIAQDHHVAVVFAKEGEQKPNVKDMHSVTAVIGVGKGQVDGTLNVPDGADHRVTWTPEEGWEVQTVIIDGEVRDDLKDAGMTEFKDIQEDHTVTVLFQKEGTEEEKAEGSFTIRTEKEGKGTISNSAVINKGGEYTVNWAADEGYIVSRVEIDGVVCPELLDKGQAVFKDIACDHKISVIFEREDGATIPAEDIVHVLTDVLGGLGQITGNFTAEKGEDVSVQWRADEGYVVSMVYVNGKERPDLVSGSEGIFTLKAIQEDMKVEVLFVEASEEKPVGSSAEADSKNKAQKDAATGDGTPVGTYLIIAALSLAAAGASSYRRCKTGRKSQRIGTSKKNC